MAASPRPSPRPAPLPELAEALRGARRVAVLGVGSDLRGDDVAGLRVATRLAAWARREGVSRLAAFAGGAAPENFTGEVRRFGPDCVVLVDAAHLGLAPGALAVIPAGQVVGLAFSTHMLPVPILLDYLAATTGCRTVVVGIQLAQKEVMAPLTPAVERGVRRLVALLKAAVSASARPSPARSSRR